VEMECEFINEFHFFQLDEDEKTESKNNKRKNKEIENNKRRK
jgi:hypothetical protein